MAGGWTEERWAFAKAEAEKGVSASNIARALHGMGFSVTRNGVIGKLHRMGLKCRGSAGDVGMALRAAARAKRPTLAPPPRRSPSPPSVAMVAQPAPPSVSRGRSHVAPAQAASLLHLTAGGCRFPVGAATGADQLFCGCERTPGHPSYCATHLKIAVSGRVAMAA